MLAWQLGSLNTASRYWCSRSEFTLCPLSRRWCAPQRRSASLIGCLGQARFPSFFWVFVAHPGHASLRSLFDAPMAPLHAYVGSVVENLALRRASRCAADIFGFIHRPRPVRTTPLGLGGWRFRSCRTLHTFLTEFRAINPHAMQ